MQQLNNESAAIQRVLICRACICQQCAAKALSATRRTHCAVLTEVYTAEAFVVCQHYTQPEGFQPADLQRLMQGASHAYFNEQGQAGSRVVVPFLACGDLSGWDADQSYDLPGAGYQTLPPVQPPTAPAYKTAIERSKQGQS